MHRGCKILLVNKKLFFDCGQQQHFNDIIMARLVNIEFR